MIARVLPDVTGLDKEFDYSIPDALAGRVEVGAIVRVELHGRRVGGWVTALLDQSEVDPAELKPIAKVTGHGPRADVQELARWASTRWAARRIRPFLVAGAPRRAVTALPAPRHTARSPQPSSPATTTLLAAGGGVLRLAPRVDVLPTLLSAIAIGPTLVVVPLHTDMALIATRLRRAGCTVAVVPDDWAAAAAGVDVVIGTRRAAWMPCDGMAAAVVLDEHDEALQDERTPTWHARDVVVERCRRAGVPYVLVSPTPTLVAVEEYAGPEGVVHPPAERERRGWPDVTVIDRTDDEPWRRSLVTSPLIELLRSDARIVCVSNTTGRARVLACRSCSSLLRCERCDAAVGLDDDGRLGCRRCEERRPPVCQACGGGSFANLRPGVTRLREELEAAANRPVASLTGDDDVVPDADIVVGTEAALHRIRETDVVVFLEFDSEMLAPRFRASEQALALVVRAARLAPRVAIQTFEPEHEVVRAARHGDPSIVIEAERERRRLLSLPPFGALAQVSGSGIDEFLDGLAAAPGGADLAVGRLEERRAIIRGTDWWSLGTTLNAVERPSGARLRVEVDPNRV